MYHMGYANMKELYDDLKETINDIEINDNVIIIKYQNEELRIELDDGWYKTYISGNFIYDIEDQDIYEIALEFANDNIKSGFCNVSYDDITEINEDGIIYETFGKIKHLIDFKLCSYNWSLLNNESIENCIGERNKKDIYFIFYTGNIKTKLDLSDFFIFKFMKRCLFREIQQEIESFGYNTFDL